MERILPKDDFGPTNIAYYLASSVADVVNGRDYLVEDTYSAYERWRNNLSPLRRFLAEKLIAFRDLGLAPNSPERKRLDALIYLPKVEHKPNLDKSYPTSLMISDPTEEMEIKIPTSRFGLGPNYTAYSYARSIAQENEIPFDKQLLKECHWFGDVILLGAYNWPDGDNQYLVF